MNMIPTAMIDEEYPIPPKGFEWVDGELVEKNMGYEAGIVGLVLGAELVHFVRAGNLGVVANSEGSFQFKIGSSRRVRKPDISFVSRERMPAGQVPRGNAIIAPDLAVEIVSPNDIAEDVERKLAEMLQVGTRLLWIVYPASRSIWVLRANGSACRLTESQELDGEDVLPGFRCSIQQLFASL